MPAPVLWIFALLKSYAHPYNLQHPSLIQKSFNACCGPYVTIEHSNDVGGCLIESQHAVRDQTCDTPGRVLNAERVIIKSLRAMGSRRGKY